MDKERIMKEIAAADEAVEKLNSIIKDSYEAIEVNKIAGDAFRAELKKLDL